MLHKYLLLRGNTYHFRWRIPADLRSIIGSTELVKTLRTADRLQASVRAGRFLLAVDAIQRIRCSYRAERVNRSEYLSTVKHYWYAVNSKSKEDEELIKIELITAWDGTVIDYDGDSEKEMAVYQKMKENGLIPERPVPERLPVINDTPTTILFSELFKQFIEFKTDPKKMAEDRKKAITLKVQQNHKRHYEGVVAVIGDIEIGSITRKLLKSAILTYGNLPKRNLKKYKGVDVLELFEMDIPEEDRLSDKSIIEVRKSVQGFFILAVEKELIEYSPARDLKLNLNSTCTFAQYSNKEVQKLLSSSFKEKILWKKWIVFLAAYTGARRGELCQLRKQDVKLDTDSGRRYLLVTEDAGDLKTDKATRQIPIHSVLIENGFLKFVESVEGRLFGELKPAAITQWFTALRERMGIEKFDDYGNRKVFHSFRRCFITRSIGAGNPVTNVQQVCGHEKMNIGMTGRYLATHDLKVVLDVVDKVSYE